MPNHAVNQGNENGNNRDVIFPPNDCRYDLYLFACGGMGKDLGRRRYFHPSGKNLVPRFCEGSFLGMVRTPHMKIQAVAISLEAAAPWG